MWIDVFHYDAQSGIYTNTTKAPASPEEPGSYLIPAHATKEKPPAVDEGELAVFENGAWLICLDKRGLWYDNAGAPVMVTDPRQDTSGLGQNPPPGEGYTRNLSGLWIVNEAAQAQLRAAALDWLRGRRSRILGMLDGMQVSAMTKALSALTPEEAAAENDLASAIEVAKQALRDLPQTDLSECIGSQACQEVLQAELDSIAAALPEPVRKAFA